MHHCCPDCESTFDEDSVELTGYLDATPPPALSVCEDSLVVVEALVTAAGRDPATATVAEMDEADLRFWCEDTECERECLR